MKKPLSSLCSRTVAVTLMSAILSGTFAMLAATTAAAGPATGEFSNFEIRH